MNNPFKKSNKNNSFGTSKDWDIPATLEEFEKKIREQSENSPASESEDTEQEEGTETFEVRFVPNSLFKKK